MRCKKAPIVIPVATKGIASILPLKTYMPKTGKSVHVSYGEPIEGIGQLLVKNAKSSDVQTRTVLTNFVQDHYEALHRKI